MSGRLVCMVFLLAASAVAQGQDAAAKQPKRWGMALQIDLSNGGDKLGDLASDSDVRLGQGLTLSGGVFFRPIEHSNFEMQVLAGYKGALPFPVTGGVFTDVTRWVFQVLADYRNNDKWYWGGGLVLHGNPKIYDDYYGAYRVQFDDAVGAVVEGGWNWVGLQCTYIQYHSSATGNLDASNCGVRFTLHFRKWHPAN